MHLWYDSLSSKDLLEACAVRYGAYFCHRVSLEEISTEVTTIPNRLTVDP